MVGVCALDIVDMRFQLYAYHEPSSAVNTLYLIDSLGKWSDRGWFVGLVTYSSVCPAHPVVAL